MNKIYREISFIIFLITVISTITSCTKEESPVLPVVPITRIFNEVDIHPWYTLSKWIKFSVDSKFLLSSNGVHSNIWDVETGKIASEINEAFVDINGEQYSFVTGINFPFNIISIWQGIPPQLKYTQLDGYEYRSKISSDGKKLLTAYYGGELHVRDLENPVLSYSRWPGNEWSEDHINIIKLSQDDELIASYGTHNLTFYKLFNGEMVFELGLCAQNLAFSPNGDEFAIQILGNSSIIQIRDRQSGELIKELNTGTALYYAFNLDGSKIVYSTNDDVRIWDVEKNELAEILFEESGANFRGVAYSPNGKFIAAKKYQSDIWIYGPINN